MKHSVLVIGNFLSETLGTRGICEDLAIRLDHSGWTVISASSRLGRVSRLLDMIGTAWNKRQSYTVAQVDVYSGLAFLWAEAVCQILRLAGKPYVLTLHGGNLPAFAQHWHGRVRRLLRSAPMVTTPSRYLFEQMQIYRADLHLLPNALDLAAYDFKLRSLPTPRLVWLRAFHDIYNPSLAVRAAALLVRHYPELKLLMIGPDKGDGSLQRARQDAASLGIADRVTFQSAVPKTAVPVWLNKGDIFLNTTNIDNTPVSVIESMACGLCVVSTNVGGITYLLQDGADALLVPPNEPEAMAIAVRRILTNLELAQQLSSAARKKAEQFDWSTVLPQWERLLISTARRRDI